MTDLYRAQGVLDRTVVSMKKIACFGFGSLGSLLGGDLLAYDWGAILLADPQNLERENIERHLLGASEIGKPKVEGGKRWLVSHGVPADHILTHVGNAQDVLKWCEEADLIIVTIDSRRACRDINAWCVDHNKPAIYGGVYPMGTGGQVIVVPNPKEACFACAEHMMGSDQFQDLQAHDYGIDIARLADELGGAQNAIPALRWSISAIASDMADIALSILTGKGGEEAPHVLIHAHNWESILNLRAKSAGLTSVANFIAQMPKLKLLPNMKLRWLPGDGVYELLARRGVFSLKLERWSECPLHSSQMSASQI